MQGELNFDKQGTPGTDGIALWHKQREKDLLELAKRLGLPVGQNVEVWLRSGVRLRGRLQLHEDMLIHSMEDESSKFAVDGIPFLTAEVESCVRI